MLYQLPNGKVIYLTIDQFLELTDEDIQYMISLEYGDYAPNPFTDSAVVSNAKERFYDFEEYLPNDDDENNKSDECEGFDDIINVTGPLDI